MHPSPTPSSSRAERHLQAGAFQKFYVTFTVDYDITVLLSMMLFRFVGYLVVFTIGLESGRVTLRVAIYNKGVLAPAEY